MQDGGMVTIDEHAAAVARLIEDRTRGLPSRARRADAVSVARHPRRHAARVLAADVHAAVDVPLFDNSQMDGFAVRAADLEGASDASPVTLPIGDPVAAGDAASALPPGVARPIMTGAPIPFGADAVVPVERTRPGRFDVDAVSFTGPVAEGTFVRPRGVDVVAGALLARAGSPLRLAQLGAFAAAGVERIALRRRLRVLVVTTGRELAVAEPAPGRPAAIGALAPGHLDVAAGLPGDTAGVVPGRIPDAIGGMLSVAIHRAGARPRAIVCASDDVEQFSAAIAAHLDWADVVVTVGGVSKGAYEVVRLALGPHGVAFTHVAMQPGGPQGLGILPPSSSLVPRDSTGAPRLPLQRAVSVHGCSFADEAADAGGSAAGTQGAGTQGAGTQGAGTQGTGTPVVCFPGNPVSALVSFEAFLRPVLRRLAGLSPAERRTSRVPLASALDSPAHQHQLRRGTLRDDGRVEPLGGPGSHLIAHYGAADAIIHVPVGVTRLEAGDDVEVWHIDD